MKSAIARRPTQEEQIAGSSPEARERLAPPRRRVDCNITLEKLHGDITKSTSRNDLSDPSRLRAPKTRNLHERDLVGRDDMLHRAKVTQQAMRQRWTDAWQSLKHVKLLRCHALRLSVVSLQTAGFRSAYLVGQTAKDPERVLGITSVNNWKAPHHRQRHDRTLQRMRMNVGHSRWLRAFEQDDGAMWAASKLGRLGEESAVYEGRREIRIGLSFNEDAGAQEVIANREPF